ncbi:hypothetical protein ARMGADRAFT_946577 [Armillaria gallica]|uniref:Helicase n=1 Tax=Armillaria gallica TaxID=47427 RepID=A0A2H3D287_ARMGA|nr:hypothetical protein ARMGADRAFT_946577 [Armillaria gallica]
MAAHKSQGQTLENVIVDLQCCRDTEAPYVMISRVKSLDDLVILQDFDYKHISSHQSENFKKETHHLCILWLLTQEKYSTNQERGCCHCRAEAFSQYD